MPISSCTSYFSQCAVYKFHQEVKGVFSPLASQGKITEVAKRVGIAIIVPFAYLILGTIALVGFLNPFRVKDIYEGVYYVRFLNAPMNPGVNELKNVVDADFDDLLNPKKRYHKGASLYTPNSIQPLAAFDPRHGSGTGISVEYPFALMINPKVELHYWSLLDMDRNSNRERHDEAKKQNLEKYKPESSVFHNLFAQWRIIHFTSVEAFIKKIDCVAAGAKTAGGTYTTSGGKQKEIKEIKGDHNEAAISYKPEDVQGILIKNSDANIRLAKLFKEKYVDQNGSKVFENVPLAYQDANGKIVWID